MSEISDVERADQLGRQRARVLPALLLIFFAGQFAFWSEPDATRVVDQVRLAAWAAYVIVFLLFLGHGGGFILSKGVRRLLNDESFRANRVRAQAAGFWGSILTGFALYFVTMTDLMTARKAIHLTVSIGIGAAILTLAWLEHRAHRDA
jgi:hypothetical protein